MAIINYTSKSIFDQYHILKYTLLKYFSIIIAYYKNKIALELILKALENQSCQNFEVIIAEDDIKSDFPFIEQSKLKQKIKHVFQNEDVGFRKNAMLNKALKIAEGQYIIFVDGDCIPDKNFVKAYDKWIQDDHICFGRRVMIGPKMTTRLYESKDLSMLTFAKLLFSDTTRLKYMLSLPFIKQKKTKGIWGHNWCVAKHHLLEINGFDQDYQTAGVGEDVDIEWRLLSKGLQLYSIRFAAIQFHLHHTENYDAVAIQTGLNQLEEKMKIGNIRCTNGLDK